MEKTEINALKNKILTQALSGLELKDIFVSLCETIASPLAINRMSMGMPTLHPLLEAQSIRWTIEDGIDTIDSEHGYSEQDDWLLSPVSYMFENELQNLRYRLDQPGDWQRFPLLRELAQAGCTEYFATVISFNELDHPNSDDGDGMLASWSTKRSGGFLPSFDDFVDEIKPALGIACKLADRENAIVNIVEAYLGKDAGSRVLKGQIERGELVTIDTIIWYSDLRQSTWLAENLSNQAFLDTLNSYFECTAGSVLEHRGEVLRFIGDAVLAIFPIANFDSKQAAAQSALCAVNQARKRIEKTNVSRLQAGMTALDFGLALHSGSLEYGNIGIANRLEFSVIGTVANEVARIEELTKSLNEPVLVSESFAELLNIQWKCMGPQPMKGVKDNPLIYAPVC